MSLMAIALNYGLCTIIDAEDFDKISSFKWRACFRPHTIYASATTSRKGGAKKTTVYMHRLLVPDVPEVDHWDRVGLNNRRKNLRPATRSQQVWNTAGRSAHTGLPKGVTKVVRLAGKPKPYQARIAHRGVQMHLGYFSTAEEAADIYAAKAAELQGEFAPQ